MAETIRLNFSDAMTAGAPKNLSDSSVTNFTGGSMGEDMGRVRRDVQTGMGILRTCRGRGCGAG